jgi:hypothetical protein
MAGGCCGWVCAGTGRVVLSCDRWSGRARRAAKAYCTTRAGWWMKLADAAFGEHMPGKFHLGVGCRVDPQSHGASQIGSHSVNRFCSSCIPT